MDIRIDPADVNHAYVLSVGVLETKDGGKTWASAFRFGGDNHALWIDPKNSKHMMLGYDHGMGITFDGGLNWYHPDELPLAQFYAVGTDKQDALQRVRRPAGQRIGARAEQQARRPPDRVRGLADGGRRRRVLQRRRPHRPLSVQRVAVRLHVEDRSLHG